MSPAKGPAFELQVYEYFRALIDKGDFPAKKECCKIYSQKGYYSKDRDAEIKFDVSIEIFMPGATEYSILFLVECKDYSGTIPVGEVQKFAEDLRQVGPGNTKGVIVSTSAFQSAALNYAKSQKLGIVRYFSQNEFKWELQRSPSATAILSPKDDSTISRALQDENFRSATFDCYFQTPFRLSNSLYEFFGDLITGIPITPKNQKQILNRAPSTRVPYRTKREIEDYSSRILNKIGYKDGYVALERICELERNRYGLRVSLDVSREVPSQQSILGRIDFRTPQIEVFYDDDYARARFTLAHELSHSLLNHGKYLLREACEEIDFTPGALRVNIEDVQRMEIQANYLSSCLLLPQYNLSKSLLTILEKLNVKRRTFAPLYVDNQPWNLDIFREVMGRLMNEFRTSQTALCIRLEKLKLLKDDRLKNVTRIRDALRAPYRG